MIPVITVDGPSGAGKGTLCQKLAEATQFHFLDSGALYRLTALACLQAGEDLQSELAVSARASALDIHFDMTPTGAITRLAGKDVSSKIREEAVGMAASTVAAYPRVREALLQKQRDFQKTPGLIADGRDMGTVVFPAAPAKIFLTASAEARAARRVAQLEEKGSEVDPDAVLADIQARDARDQGRQAAPLMAAEDALVLDSTQLSIQEVFDNAIIYVRERIPHV